MSPLLMDASILHFVSLAGALSNDFVLQVLSVMRNCRLRVLACCEFYVSMLWLQVGMLFEREQGGKDNQLFIHKGDSNKTLGELRD